MSGINNIRVGGSFVPPQPQGQQGGGEITQGPSYFTSFTNSLYNGVGSVGSFIGNSISSGFETGRSVINGGIEIGTNVVNTGIETGKSVVNTGIEIGTNVVNTGIETGKSVVNTGIEIGTNVVNTGVEIGKSVVNTGIDIGTNVVNTGIETGKSVVNTGIDIGTNVINTGIQTGKSMVTGGISMGKQMGNTGLEYGLGMPLHLGTFALQSTLKLGVSLFGIDVKPEQITLLGSLGNAPDFDVARNQDKEKLSGEFVAQMKNQKCTGGERAVLERLDSLCFDGKDELKQVPGSRHGNDVGLTRQQFHTALMRGTHFVVEDGGKLYDQLKKDSEGGLVERGSSHYKKSTHPQYGMDLPGGIGHLLLGRTETGGTFFQLESHGVGGGNKSWSEWGHDLVGHTQSWFQHIGTSGSYVQIGPHGCVEGSEKDNNHVILQPLNQQ